MSRQTQRLITIILLVVALIAVAFWLLRQREQPGAVQVPVGTPPTIDQGGLWEVAFTTPLPAPDDPARHVGGIDTRLMNLMDKATRTLDVAIYDFDLANVADAMARAARRGVRVRMVTDSDTLENTREPAVQSAFRMVTEAGITVVPDRRQPIMHNKFTVIDGELVQTGSWNYTDGDTYRLNNNQAIFRSRELAENYTTEFEKMFTQRVFGPSKPKGIPFPTLNIGPLPVTSSFSPGNDVANQIAARVNTAERKVHFLAFSFTHNGIGDAMVARHQNGVEVSGVFETTGSNTQFSEFGKLRNAGAAVFQDGNPYVMHHKVILLDDRTTIFGSFNFSDNADRDNDENLLIVDDPTFTALFEQEFQRVLAAAKNRPQSK